MSGQNANIWAEGAAACWALALGGLALSKETHPKLSGSTLGAPIPHPIPSFWALELFALLAVRP